MHPRGSNYVQNRAAFSIIKSHWFKFSFNSPLERHYPSACAYCIVRVGYAHRSGKSTANSQRQGAVTPIDAVVSAATGVTMGSQGHGGFVGRSRGHGGFCGWSQGHGGRPVIKIFDYYFLLPAPAFA